MFIEFEKLTLSNGMDLVLHQDNALPIVSVNVWYHVGSKDEEPGKTGYAHLFEHLMFEGSKNHNKSFFEPLQDIGATLNGSTTPDRTNYWENVPSNYLELALWLESDRMGFLTDALDQNRFDIQRDVVKNERRQSYENRPYGMASIYLQQALYPLPHPYHWPTIGFHEDLNSATLEDAKKFFREFYSPSNASLSIAGDFDVDKTKTQVEKYFGSLKQGPSLNRKSNMESMIQGKTSITLYDKVLLPKLILAWPSTPRFHEDEAALSILASILGAGKVSRLHKTLVYERRIAQSVGVGNGPSEIAGEFYLEATAAPDHSIKEIEDAVLGEIEKIQKEPPSQEELQRIKNVMELQRIRQMAQVGGFGGRANRLNSFNVFAGDPGLINTDFERYIAVTPEDISRVAQTYLSARLVSLVVLPEPSLNQTPEDVDRSLKPSPEKQKKFNPPVTKRTKLGNGLNVLLVEKQELPIVTFGLLLGSGASTDPSNKPGLSALTSSMLQEGTTSHTSQEISSEFEFMGTQLNISVGRERTVFSTATIDRYFAKAMELISDIVKNPSFPPDEFDRIRKERLTSLRRLRDDSTALASRVAPGLIYGSDSAYGHPIGGTEESVGAFEIEDLIEYWKANYDPDSATLLVVGNVSLDDVKDITNKYFGDWNVKITDNQLEKPMESLYSHSANLIYLLDKPGAAQSIIRCGVLGPPRINANYSSLILLDSIFGGQFTSRLNMNLRQDKGYSYGYRSWIDWHKKSSLFGFGGAVETDVTGNALNETIKEARRIIADTPVSRNEFESAKAGLIREFPSLFETQGQILEGLAQIVSYDLPDDYYNHIIDEIASTSLEDVNRVAKEILSKDRLVTLLVGDRSVIEEQIKTLGWDICLLDHNGRIITN
ncbi:MAG: insulinase family protein [Dehalococcoidia bacterium]|nr:insulinase family protein [Dehalococcoidia bacterium]